MTLIEGIGDEVTQFFGVLLLLLLGVVAWWSTRISELPQIRTVLIFERRAQSDVGNPRQTVTNQPERNVSDTSSSRSDTFSRNADEKTENVVPNETVTQESAASGVGDLPATPDVSTNEPGHEQKCCEQSDAEVEPCDETAEEAAPSEENTDDTPTEEAGQDVDNIRIRLKYLNEDQKLVRGKLGELLGDFKRRHFSVELSREKRVRLIFNGQVLQSDEQTLQGYGLYDNCVVHCLVHQQVNTNRSSSQQAPNANAAPPEWNLGGVLYASLSLLLGLTWLLRYHYSQLFTLTTTTALTGLTAMFAVSIIGMYMPDHEAPAA